MIRFDYCEGLTVKPEMAEFFRISREKYEWPKGIGRTLSEKRIHRLQYDAQAALNSQNIDRLVEILVAIHEWKTKNRGGQSTSYAKVLSKNPSMLEKVIELMPLSINASAEEVITFLMLLDMKHSRVPVCTAQLSFLSGRQFPILDRYIGQLMSQQFDPLLFKSKEYDFKEICQIIGKIDFAIVKGASGTRSLATQGASNTRNRKLYATQLIPQLKDVAEQLNMIGVQYKAHDGTFYQFTCVDVEMALFAFATHNARYFSNF
jgi:hypothetical protein